MTENPHWRKAWRLAGWMVVLAGGAAPQTTRAHSDSEATIDLRIEPGQLRGSWQADLRDLDHALDLDANGDGRLTRAEWEARSGEAARFVRRHLGCSVQGRPLGLEFGEWILPLPQQGAGVRIEFTADLPAVVSGLRLEYTAFFDGDPWHRGHATLTRSDGTTAQTLLTPDQRHWSIDPVVPLAPVVPWGGASRGGLPWCLGGGLAVVLLAAVHRAVGFAARGQQASD